MYYIHVPLGLLSWFFKYLTLFWIWNSVIFHIICPCSRKFKNISHCIVTCVSLCRWNSSKKKLVKSDKIVPNICYPAGISESPKILKPVVKCLNKVNFSPWKGLWIYTLTCWAHLPFPKQRFSSWMHFVSVINHTHPLALQMKIIGVC